ncbi:MAG TPA: FAD binding domain-containing protein, partial [Candidatus Eisenbacteria bacterium]
MLTLPVFEWVRPTSVDGVLRELAEHPGECLLMAGGTDAVPNLKHRLHEPRRVVALAGVRELHEVRETAAGLELGALVTLSALARLPALQRDYAAVARAASLVASPQIRNMGTLGGNLCQRNRCWYFRDEHVNCFLKGGEKCFALDGENQFHAVFTQGHKCVMVNPSTLAPVLIALGASAVVLGPKGRRTLKLAD